MSSGITGKGLPFHAKGMPSPMLGTPNTVTKHGRANRMLRDFVTFANENEVCHQTYTANIHLLLLDLPYHSPSHQHAYSHLRPMQPNSAWKKPQARSPVHQKTRASSALAMTISHSHSETPRT